MSMDSPTGDGGSVDSGASAQNTQDLGGSQQPGSNSGQSAEPTVYDLTNDGLIKVKGSDKPVKFSEYARGFQSQFTKASQEAARLKREVQARDERLKALERAQQQNPQGNPQGDVFEALRQLPYLSGADAVELVQQIGGQIQQRDQVLLAALKQLQEMQGIVRGLKQSHSGNQFEAKMAKFLADGGYDPADYGDLAKEIYLAYTGDDLDTEFPNILRSRIEQIEKAIERKRAAKVQANRKAPFLPGKGGTTGPSQPLQMKANLSPKEVADQLWEQLHGSDT